MAKAPKKNVPRKPRARKRVLWLALPALALALALLIPQALRRRQAVAHAGQQRPADHAGHHPGRSPRLCRLRRRAYAQPGPPGRGRGPLQRGLQPGAPHLAGPLQRVQRPLPPGPPGAQQRQLSPSGCIDTLAEILARRGYRTSAFVSSFVLDSRFGLDQGFAVYDDDLAAGGAKTYHSERDAAAVFAAFSRWLDGQEDGRFFSWVHFFDPHAPYDPPEPYRSAASDPYDGEIAYMDHAIGEIISLLERKRLCARRWSSSPAIMGRPSGSMANTAIRSSVTRRICACR